MKLKRTVPCYEEDIEEELNYWKDYLKERFISYNYIKGTTYQGQQGTLNIVYEG